MSPGEDHGELRRCLTILTRLCQRRPEQTDKLRFALRAAGAWRCVQTAIEVAIEVGDPLPQVLAEELGTALKAEQSAGKNELEGALAAIPQQSVVLYDLGLFLSRELLNLLSAESPTVVARAARARAGLAFVARAGRAGMRREMTECVSVVEETIDLLRGLLQEDSREFGPQLAHALGDYAMLEFDAGNLAAGIDLLKEAISVLRQTVRPDNLQRSSDLFRLQLNLGVFLLKAGRNPEAILAVREAETRGRSLRDSSHVIDRLNYSTCLLNLAFVLDENGERAEAMVRVLEGTALARRISEEAPDVGEPALADCLVQAATVLIRAERIDEAKGLIEEGLEIRRRLARARPGQFASQLAHALNTAGTIYEKAKDPSRSRAVLQESIQVWQELVPGMGNPEVASLAVALANLGSSLEDHEAALGLIRQALTLTDRLLGANDQRAYLMEVSGVFNLAGAVHAKLGQHKDALVCFMRAREIHERLVEHLPQGFSLQLGDVLNNIAGMHNALGQSADAEAILDRAIAGGQRLLGSLPGAAQALQRWLENHAKVMHQRGDPDLALQSWRRAVHVLRGFLMQVGVRSDVRLACDVGFMTLDLAILERRAGRAPACRAAARECLALAEEISALELPGPSGIQALRDCATLMNNLGGEFRAIREAELALSAAKGAVACYRKVSVKCPGDVDASLQLATGLRNLALTLDGAGNTDDAVLQMSEAAELRTTLTALDPGATELVLLCGRTLCELASLHMKAGDSSSAMKASRDALRVTWRVVYDFSQSFDGPLPDDRIGEAKQLMQFMFFYASLCAETQQEIDPDPVLHTPWAHLLERMPGPVSEEASGNEVSP